MKEGFLPFAVTLHDGTLFHVLSDEHGHALVQINYQGYSSMPSALAHAIVEGAARGATDLPVAPFPPFEPFSTLYYRALAIGLVGGALIGLAHGERGWLLCLLFLASAGVLGWAKLKADDYAGAARAETLNGRFRRVNGRAPFDPVRLYKVVDGSDGIDHQIAEGERFPERSEALQLMYEAGGALVQHEHLTWHGVSDETIQYLLVAGLIEVMGADEQEEEDSQ